MLIEAETLWKFKPGFWVSNENRSPQSIADDDSIVFSEKKNGSKIFIYVYIIFVTKQIVG